MWMRIGILGVVLMAFTVFSSDSSVLGQDKVVGAIWEIKFEAKNPKNVVVWKFRATPDGKVWNVPAKGKPVEIGKWSGDESNTKMEIRDMGGPNGKLEFVMVKKDPPAWTGEFVNANNGNKRPVKVRLIKD